MIPHGVEVFVGLDPIDLRWGFERLSGLVTAYSARPGHSFRRLGHPFRDTWALNSERSDDRW
jgi:hypothetical protein